VFSQYVDRLFDSSKRTTGLAQPQDVPSLSREMGEDKPVIEYLENIVDGKGQPLTTVKE
jgi:hypothetical protein